MKGKILEFSIQNGVGVISADDGKRYNFSASEWKSDKSPTANQMVDFIINGEDATGIYLEKAKYLLENVALGVQKNKVVAALLAFFLGMFGIHKFYIGCNKAGIITLLITFFGFILLYIPTIIVAIIAIIEAVKYIIKSDDEFQRTYVENKKCWF